MYCNKCGNEIPDNVKFCVKCGNPTSDEQPVSAETGVQKGTVIVQASGGVFQKVMLLIICAVFLVIMFVVVSFYMENKQEKTELAQQNEIALRNQEVQQKQQAKEQEQNELKIAYYESNRGSWKVDSAYVNGEWEADYNFWGEAIGDFMDFRNLYEFGNDTNYGAGTYIELNADSIDMSAIGWGIYSLDGFSFELDEFGKAVFTNENEGLQLYFTTFQDEPYLRVSQWTDNGWLEFCDCVKA